MHQVCSPSPTPVLGPWAVALRSSVRQWAPTLPHCQLEARRPNLPAAFPVWEDRGRTHAQPGRAASFTGQSSPTHCWPPVGSVFKRRHDVSEFQASRDETKSSTTARQEMQGGLWGWSTHLLPGCVDTHTLHVCVHTQTHAYTYTERTRTCTPDHGSLAAWRRAQAAGQEVLGAQAVCSEARRLQGPSNKWTSHFPTWGGPKATHRAQDRHS